MDYQDKIADCPNCGEDEAVKLPNGILVCYHCDYRGDTPYVKNDIRRKNLAGQAWDKVERASYTG